MVDEYDVIEFLGLLAERCVELLETDEAGIMLADSRGNLQAIASSSERTRLLELFELQNEEGPCLDAFRTGEMVASADLATTTSAGRRFASRATNAGFGGVRQPAACGCAATSSAHSTCCVTRQARCRDADLALARALADVATIGLLQERAVRESRTSAGQLQTRLVQPGAHRAGQGRHRRTPRRRHRHCVRDGCAGTPRRHGRKLTELARAVVESQFDCRSRDRPLSPAARHGLTPQRQSPDGRFIASHPRGRVAALRSAA